MSDLATLRVAQGDSVSIVEALGEWHVHIIEGGRSTIVSFDMRSFAHAYAYGQRRRLGLMDHPPAPASPPPKEKGQRIAAPT